MKNWKVYIMADGPREVDEIPRSKYQPAELVYLYLVEKRNFPPGIWIECGGETYNKPKGVN